MKKETNEVRRCNDCKKRLPEVNISGFCKRCFYKPENMSEKIREQRRKASQKWRDNEKQKKM